MKRRGVLVGSMVLVLFAFAGTRVSCGPSESDPRIADALHAAIRDLAPGTKLKVDLHAITPFEWDRVVVVQAYDFTQLEVLFGAGVAWCGIPADMTWGQEGWFFLVFIDGASVVSAARVGPVRQSDGWWNDWIEWDGSGSVRADEAQLTVTTSGEASDGGERIHKVWCR